MQIVIDMPDTYITENIIRTAEWEEGSLFDQVLRGALKQAIILPKGHGELVDRNAINERFYSIYNDAINCSNQPSDKYLLDKLSMCLDTAPTIIEADNEVEE